MYSVNEQDNNHNLPIWSDEKSKSSVKQYRVSEKIVDLAIRVSVSCSCFFRVMTCIFSRVNSCFDVF